MNAVSLFLLTSAGISGLLAQADLFKQAPPDVDQALRARVNKFYQSYVDGKPRPAMAYVAEDTRDLWFDSDKPKYKSFELLKISYSDDFRKASVTILAEQQVRQKEGEFLMRVPMTATWRIDDGQWYYYVDVSVRGIKATPFGKMRAGEGESTGISGLSRLTDPSKIFSGVWLNKSVVRLGAADEVVISNDLPGSVHLKLEVDKFEGLSGTLEKSELGASEKMKVRFTFKNTKNGTAAPLQARVIVQETNQALPITIKLD